MSTEIEKDILCPQCGQSQKYRLYASINAKENPELKDAINDTIAKFTEDGTIDALMEKYNIK